MCATQWHTWRKLGQHAGGTDGTNWGSTQVAHMAHVWHAGGTRGTSGATLHTLGSTQRVHLAQVGGTFDTCCSTQVAHGAQLARTCEPPTHERRRTFPLTLTCARHPGGHLWLQRTKPPVSEGARWLTARDVRLPKILLRTSAGHFRARTPPRAVTGYRVLQRSHVRTLPEAPRRNAAPIAGAKRSRTAATRVTSHTQRRRSE